MRKEPLKTKGILEDSLQTDLKKIKKPAKLYKKKY